MYFCFSTTLLNLLSFFDLLPQTHTPQYSIVYFHAKYTWCVLYPHSLLFTFPHLLSHFSWPKFTSFCDLSLLLSGPCITLQHSLHWFALWLKCYWFKHMLQCYWDQALSLCQDRRYKHRHMSTHRSLKHFSYPFPLLFLSITFTLQTLGNALDPFFFFLISIDTASGYSSAYWWAPSSAPRKTYSMSSYAVRQLWFLELIIVSWKDLTLWENSNSYGVFPWKEGLRINLKIM